jgi:hypothetical protein
MGRADGPANDIEPEDQHLGAVPSSARADDMRELPEVLNEDHLAAVFRVKRETILNRAWRKASGLPGRMVARGWFVTKRTFLVWLESESTAQAPDAPRPAASTDRTACKRAPRRPSGQEAEPLSKVARQLGRDARHTNV